MENNIVKDYINGLTMPDITKKYGMHYRQIRNILKDNNVKIRSQSEINKTRKRTSKYTQYKKEMCNLYKENTTLKQLAEKYNCTQNTIKYWLKKWGVTLRTKSESGTFGAETRRQHWLQEYGVENPMQVPSIFEERSKKMYKFKSITVDGIDFKLQGFEPLAVYHLINEGVLAKDIKCGRDVPRIKYTYNSCNKVYYPDLYIETSNSIYEIKCEYTYYQHQKRNIAKAQATAAAGYKHITLIYNNTGTEIVKTVVTDNA